MRNQFSIGIWLILMFSSACKDDDSQLPANPFKKNTVIDTQQFDIDSFNIFSLHQDLFLPTCANSGCHDGNFEPDFRTVESTYWGLVNTPVIKSDLEKKYNYRVVPFDTEKSMLWHRLHFDLNGNSGIMPLSLDANSDYPAQKPFLMDRLKKWIDSGATDMYGNQLINGDFPPVIRGIQLKQNNNWVFRNGVYEPVKISASLGPVEVYVSLFDQELLYNLKDDINVFITKNLDSFGLNPKTQLINIPAQNMPGLFNKEVNYCWKFVLDPYEFQVSDAIWMRFECENQNERIQIPNNTSMFSLKKYAAIVIN